MVTSLGEALWSELRARSQAMDEMTLNALAPTLILVPHPDDETLGCGGLIATASDLGLRPRVAYLTDGAGSHPSSAAWSPERLAAARKLEALEALRCLGVAVDDVRFLRWPDGAPWSRGDPHYLGTIEALAGWCESFRPRSLWAPWAGEPHCDHVAAARLADDLGEQLPSRPKRLQYLVWGWGRPEISAEMLVRSLDCPDTVARRRAALACHRTQMTGLISDTTNAFRIPPELAALTDRPVEIYLEAV